jgi:UDP-4-amino-4,6-dideoxy-N-acetyl-beta-L-altrosamine N-acetyltransferase
MPNRQEYLLRPIFDSDLDQILRWRNSERIKANMYTDSVISPGDHKKWFDNIACDNSCIYRIFESQGRPIGLVNAVQIDPHNSKCSWAFYLGEVDVPSGSGAIMEFLFLEFLFEELNIRKVCCEVFSFNGSTIKLHKKFGFQQEGLFVQHVLKNSEYEDVVSLALFREDWLEVKAKMQKLCFRGDTAGMLS